MHAKKSYVVCGKKKYNIDVCKFKSLNTFVYVSIYRYLNTTTELVI